MRIRYLVSGGNMSTIPLEKFVEWEVLIEKVTKRPRQVLQLENPRIEDDAPANLTLFDPNHKWILNDESNYSKSKNSPWFGKELTGKAVAVFNNDKYWIDR